MSGLSLSTVPRTWQQKATQRIVDTTTAWVDRITRWAPVRTEHVERVAFDTRAMSAVRSTGEGSAAGRRRDECDPQRPHPSTRSQPPRRAAVFRRPDKMESPAHCNTEKPHTRCSLCRDPGKRGASPGNRSCCDSDRTRNLPSYYARPVRLPPPQPAPHQATLRLRNRRSRTRKRTHRQEAGDSHGHA
ncbi:RRXRR domain-containing protein [Streptomyces sp. NL15-2K]|uniref:RRXRR domain-containing protein n=1 Tax=Streptomyces sp. NL15-2K TaxID=376149 RepID=UPI0035B54841